MALSQEVRALDPDPITSDELCLLYAFTFSEGWISTYLWGLLKTRTANKSLESTLQIQSNTKMLSINTISAWGWGCALESGDFTWVRQAILQASNTSHRQKHPSKNVRLHPQTAAKCSKTSLNWAVTVYYKERIERKHREEIIHCPWSQTGKQISSCPGPVINQVDHENNELIRRCFAANLPLTANPGSEEAESEWRAHGRSPATGAMGRRCNNRALLPDSHTGLNENFLQVGGA